MKSTQPGPLAGITVVDLTRVLSGPYCTMVLGDLGARVIKVEHPQRGDDTRRWGPPFLGAESAYFLSVNRNKESVTLDFQHPEGRRVLDALIARADVFVENFRPGTLERYGLDGPALVARYPRLIACSISGYGQTGPRADEPGYDAVIQAEGGLMSITGPAGGPNVRLGVAISDLTAGMFAAHGILAALIARKDSGRGQCVDIGMLDTTAALLTYQAAAYFATGEPPRPLGNRHPTIVPYETLPTSDGEVVVAVGNDTLWDRFCTAAGLESLVDDPRFVCNRDRVVNYDVLRPLLHETFRSRTRAEWIARLKDAGVPCGAVRDLGEVFDDPQLESRGMTASVTHATVGEVRVVGSPIRMSGTPASVRTAPPTLGAHTATVLVELGLGSDAIERLRSAGAI